MSEINEKCRITQDLIADEISGLLNPGEKQDLQQHLEKCHHCRSYAENLQKEHELLLQLFADSCPGTINQENEVIEALGYLKISKTTRALYTIKAAFDNPITKLAGAAAVVAFLAAYTIVTLSWLAQIEQCIYTCS